MRLKFFTMMCCLAIFGSCAQTKTSDNLFLVVGSYSDGTTSGITVYDFNIKTGDFVYLSDLKQIANPTYLAVSNDEQMIYSVNETREGEVSAFRFNKSEGALSFVNTQPAFGASPCYISVDKGRNFIATANYSGGNVSVFPLAKDGSINPKSMNFDFNPPVSAETTTSPDTPPAPVSHMHAVVFSPDEKYLYGTDLGLDHIYSFEVNPDANGDFLKLLPESSTDFETGSGPRHLAFHPNGKYVYCINELSGKTTAFRYNANRLDAIQYIDADTMQTTRRKGSADIHLTSDGRFLYASNRARTNNIAIYSVNPSNGQLTTIDYQPTGAHPRNFTITPNDKYLLCANMNSNNIQIFEIDPVTGLLRNTGKEILLDKPVCMKWINFKR